jgi:hypothetical protein
MGPLPLGYLGIYCHPVRFPWFLLQIVLTTSGHPVDTWHRLTLNSVNLDMLSLNRRVPYYIFRWNGISRSGTTSIWSESRGKIVRIRDLYPVLEPDTHSALQSVYDFVNILITTQHASIANLYELVGRQEIDYSFKLCGSKSTCSVLRRHSIAHYIYSGKCGLWRIWTFEVNIRLPSLFME